MSESVIVYSTDGCVECNYVKNMLKEEGVSFEVRDIFEKEEYQQEVEKFGFMGVPVTVYQEMAIKGFTPELKNLIAKAKN
ncbi:glutaredoxin family protein [Alkalihalobacillus trypoxylicola]|uniref:NrdH-redoxin n=1 Tax=Alkalihalobacillus trypoxylicola TaxID=519424 RepID=A0A161PHD3_9BACI|nr:glutaredoxin family protein [Alkalihalobacillus trypoxylicola]KYG32264.1 NrdH-redoxin [Alkalihalobacillus trypoxylicola]